MIPYRFLKIMFLTVHMKPQVDCLQDFVLPLRLYNKYKNYIHVNLPGNVFSWNPCEHYITGFFFSTSFSHSIHKVTLVPCLYKKCLVFTKTFSFICTYFIPKKLHIFFQNFRLNTFRIQFNGICNFTFFLYS